MATKTIQQLIDDLDGTVLEPGAGETVLFSLDGRAYEIDLTDAHAAALRDALAPYIAAGRRPGGVAAAAPRRRSGRSSSNANADMRAWAVANGYKVSDRGRLSASVQEAYAAAH